MKEPPSNIKARFRKAVTVRPASYQPTKEELEESVKIDATPEELARAVLRPARVVKDPKA